MSDEAEKPTTEIRQIAIQLTEHEIAEKAKEAAHLNQDVLDLEKELDDHKKRLKGQIDPKMEEIQEILSAVHDGVDERTVECEVKKNFETNTIEYWFEGRKVDERAMDAQDRQLTLVTPESAVGTESEDEDVRQAMKEEKDPKKKVDHLVGPDTSEDDAAV